MVAAHARIQGLLSLFPATRIQGSLSLFSSSTNPAVPLAVAVMRFRAPIFRVMINLADVNSAGEAEGSISDELEFFVVTLSFCRGERSRGMRCVGD